MEVLNLVQGAQDAMERGDYRLAIAATNHALQQYPNCLAAHRMLGEAYLERADQLAAITHFERALAVDPLNVVARLGMGVAAEETRDYKSAYAHYLHAWELNPALDQVRDELVRIRGLLNVDDRLHPTRAGLAGVHTRSGQFGRAIGEWRAILAAEPDSRRARSSIAELLWRMGDDHGAALAAREALRGCPENARALALLAELEKRRGGTNVDEFSQRYLSVDPTCDVVSVLAPWRSEADFSFLHNKTMDVADFNFVANASRDTGALAGKRIATASLAASQIAAPDLWDTLVQDLSNDGLTDNAIAPSAPASGDTMPLQPFDPAQFQEPDDLAASLFGASLANGATVPLNPAPDESETIDAPVPVETIEAPVLQTATNDTFVLSEAEAAGFADLVSAMGQSTSMDDSAAPATLPDFATAELASVANGHDASSPSADLYGATVPFNYDTTVGTVDLSQPYEAEAPVDSYVESTPPPPIAVEPPAAFVDPFITTDGKIDLTSGWDDLDRQLEAATPAGNADAAFADLLAELNVDGIQPFDVEIPSPDDDAWAPFSADEFMAGSAPAPAPDLPVASAPLYVDEAPISDGPNAASLNGSEHVLDPLREADPDQIAASAAFIPVAEIPDAPLADDIMAGLLPGNPSGYTEILRNIDEESAYIPEAPIQSDLLDSPDASGSPLRFEELIAVTSRDGTGPLESDLHSDIPDNPFDFSSTDLNAAMPPLDAEPMAYDLDGIVPFGMEAFDPGESDKAEEARIALDPNRYQMAAPAEVAPLPSPEPEIELPVLDLIPKGTAPFSFDPDIVAAADDSISFDELNIPIDLDLFPAAVLAEEIVEDPAAVVSEEPVTYTSVLRNSQIQVDEPDTQDAAAPAWAGREGLGPVARKVLWPPFVNQTSSLIDRAEEGSNLFSRIAQQKSSLVAAGVIDVHRALQPMPANVAAELEPIDAVVQSDAVPVIEVQESAPVIREIVDESQPLPVMSDQTRLDLMAMRARLSDDDESASEIAATIEQAMSEGLRAPLAQRVLGEAYLKLGQVERAAAQFRQAMLARRRTGR